MKNEDSEERGDEVEKLKVDRNGVGTSVSGVVPRYDSPPQAKLTRDDRLVQPRLYSALAIYCRHYDLIRGTTP